MDETMDNQQAKAEFDMGWLVGFIEGEGCFHLARQQYKRQKPTLRPQFSVAGTDFELIERAGSIIKSLGVGTLYVRKRPSRINDERKKDQLEVAVIGMKRCVKLLPQIIPYMTLSRKRKAAEKLLEFCEHRLSMPHGTPYGAKEFSFAQSMRDLNGYKLSQSLRDSTLGVFAENTKVESSAA